MRWKRVGTTSDWTAVLRESRETWFAGGVSTMSVYPGRGKGRTGGYVQRGASRGGGLDVGVSSALLRGRER